MNQDGICEIWRRKQEQENSIRILRYRALVQIVEKAIEGHFKRCQLGSLMRNESSRCPKTRVNAVPTSKASNALNIVSG
jgi:hypothetical protein